MKRRKLRNNRPKALFGEVAAAGITAAATLAAAGIGAAATAKAAKQQADASIEGAKQQAQSIEQTNANNNQLQMQSQQFIASENEKNRQIQRDLQMNLQLEGGTLDTEQRRMASRIQVKKGGRIKSRKRLRDEQYLLRGNNTGLKVTDGGYLEHIGNSPEGYPLYKAHGDTHKQYHKVGNKYKSGIGIKIPGRQTIEVENGETIADRLVSPHQDVAIASRLKHHGIYPAEAIDNGASVDQVIDYQEMSNYLNGNSPVEENRYYFGGILPFTLPTGYPTDNLDFDMNVANIAAINRRKLKRGGRIKALYGLNSRFNPFNYISRNNGANTGLGLNNSSYNSGSRWAKYNNGILNNYNSGNSGKFGGLTGNQWGAAINTLGNLGGAWLTSWGAGRANKYLSRGYNEAGNILSDAYGKLSGVDMSSINRDMFANQNYMPVLRAASFNVNPQLESTNREFARLMQATNAGTLSSAARQARLRNATTLADEQRSKIYAEQTNQQDKQIRENNAALNEAAARNAQLAIESNRDFTSHYIDLLKYNNDIANERITGAAQARVDALMGTANANAATANTIGQSWGNAVAGSGKSWADAIATDAKQRNDLNMALAGASTNGKYNYYMGNNVNDPSGAYAVYSDYVAMMQSAKDDRDKTEWKFRANQLASKYNFKQV